MELQEMSEMTDIPDAAIIGGGPAGYSCAVKVAQLGGKAVIVEKEELGGVCTNRGCIPTKTLHATAKLIDKMRKAGDLGVDAKFSFDFGKVMERKDRVVKTSVMGIRKLLENHGIEVVKGTGKIASKNEVRIEDAGRTIKAKNIVIATGSGPVSIPGIEGITSTEMLGLKRAPKKLLIIGGGVTGVEFAAIFSRLGSEVTVVEMMERIIPAEDEEISEALRRTMERDGTRIFTSSKVEKVSKGRAVIRTAGKTFEEHFDAVLVSVGRRPNIPSEIDSLGIKHGKNGISVDEKMQTNVGNVYAIGDVSGGPQLAHAAYEEGIVAAENIMGRGSSIDYRTVPVCIFTIPEIASAGKREPGCKTGKALFVASGKARALGETQGFVKVFVKGWKLISVSIIGENATELIAEAALIISQNIPINKIRRITHAHPTLSESLVEALENLGE
jgi:dihydrolipoamide dehydrogenase